jgi:Domain of Unknown Function (DUF748)
MGSSGLRHPAQTAVVEQRRVQQVKRVAREVSNAPGLLLRADQLRLVKGTLRFVNRAARPEYRLFLDGAEVHVHNFSNQLTEGTAAAKVTGKFMGSGQTLVGASFRPETQGPDFALAASIENTDMRALNQLLRATGSWTWRAESSRSTPSCGCRTAPCGATSSP